MMIKFRESLTIGTSRRIIFLLAVALVVVTVLPGAVFACDVTSVSLYLGETQAIAENHNTSTVYRPSGASFWFHVHWSANMPDNQGFDLVIYDYTKSETLTTCSITSPTQRIYTGNTTLQTYSFDPHTIKAKVRRKPSGTWCWSSARTLTVFKVDVDTPSSFPAYACKDHALSLGSTVTHSSAGGGTYSWSKETGPGTVTFSPSASAEDPSFSADQAGDYTVKVQYTKGVSTVSDTSGTIRVIDGLTVFPKEAYVAVNGTKDFYAWACVGGSAQNVTAQSTFSAPVDRGSFAGNTYTAPSTPSTSKGADWVRATYQGNTTDAAHDCDLTVFKVELTSPDDGTTFEINHDTMQIGSPGIICQVKALAGSDDVTGKVNLTANWELLLSWTGGGTTYYTPGPTANDKLTSSSNPFNVPATAFTTGGNLAISVDGSTDSGNYGPLSTLGITIKVDADPSNTDFSSELGSDIIRALAWQEWAGMPTARWNNYTSSGEPFVSGSNDWGVMQINKNPSSGWENWFKVSGNIPSGYIVAKWNEIAWNWKTNIANGKYIHQTYMYYKQTSTQKTWPNTAADASTPNREDLATYGYNMGEAPMRDVTSANWSDTVESHTYTQNVRGYKSSKPWE